MSHNLHRRPYHAILCRLLYNVLPFFGVMLKLLQDLRHNRSSDGSTAFADCEPLALVHSQGMEKFALHLDVIARHGHFAGAVLGAFGPEEAASFIYLTGIYFSAFRSSYVEGIRSKEKGGR